MIQMTKLLIKAIATVAVCLPLHSFGQAADAGGQAKCPPVNLTPNNAFCHKDHRSEIRAFCENLAELLTYAQTNPKLDNRCYEKLLKNLDLSLRQNTDRFITAVAPSVTLKTVMSKADVSSAAGQAGQARLDQQLSPGATTSGTTSLVSKAGSAELLSLALDTGAVTESVKGTSATLSTNADQIFRLVTGSDPDCTVTCDSHDWFENKVLNQTNVLASLNLAQQSSTTTATSGQASGTSATPVTSAAIPTGAGKLTGITARYQLMNKFDPRTEDFKGKWLQAIAKGSLKSDTKTLNDAQEKVGPILEAITVTLDRAKMVGDAKSDPSGKKLIDDFESYFQSASQKPMQDPTIGDDIAEVMKQRAVYRQAWFDTLDQAVGNLFTFEYDYNRPTNQPITHDFKLIYAYNFGTPGMLTFNGAASIYGSIPAGAKYGSLHYGQVSTEYDRTLSGKGKSTQTQLSIAGYWQYQPHPSILNIPAGTVAPGTDIPLPNGTQEFVGTAGSLWVTQAKLTIKGTGGINIPIGVSWSNKTDLLQGSKVGGQVGISYNFSSLAGLFTGSSNQ
jgi:hypothetical protein